MKEKYFLAVIVWSLLSVLGSVVLAKNTSITGVGSVNYKASLFSSKVDKESKEKAVQMALVNAWKKYTSDFTTSKYKL